jgi:hypothetical protein
MPHKSPIGPLRASSGFRSLLLKYMAHVMDAEGVSFVDLHCGGAPDGNPFMLSEKELDLLLAIEAEVHRRNKEFYK